jgi:hypothetical protein
VAQTDGNGPTDRTDSPNNGSVRTMTFERLAASTAVVVPPTAAAVVAVAGFLTPSYDPLHRTVSRLTDPGMPYSLAMRLTLAALALSLASLSWASLRTMPRGGVPAAICLAVAGVALLGVALISRDHAHPATIVAHRLMAVLFFCSLAAAPLTSAVVLGGDLAMTAYARVSLLAAAISLSMLAIGVAGVLIGGLPSGAWERLFVGVDLGWVTVLAGALARAEAGTGKPTTR